MSEKSTAFQASGGPRIVAIGGGHGLSNTLRALKPYTNNVTAIVTVADDGGGSGILRQELGMLPPGDIRNCILALSNAEPAMTRILDYRFSSGTLAGQSLGNLFLAALNDLCGSFEEAVRRMSEVLNITGRVLPVTCEDVQLHAEFENGGTVTGQSHIFFAKKENGCRIQRVWLTPERPKPLPEAIAAIQEADLIVIGPGSLYTSIIPNFLVEGVGEAVARAKGKKVYVMNIMGQVGETEDYTAAEHVTALLRHAPGVVDVCLANNAPIPPEMAEAYRREGVEPMELRSLETLGLPLAMAPLVAQTDTYARHDPQALGLALMELLEGGS